MKHLINKNLFQGGGKSKPSPQAPILKSPKLGAYKLLNSYSVAEIVDLISDGPIEGLVNQNNQILNNENSILQGVYLDNTPIQKTSNILSVADDSNVFGKVNVLDLFKKLGDRYTDNNESPKTDFHKGVNNESLNLGPKIPSTKRYKDSYCLASNAVPIANSAAYLTQKQYFYSTIIGKNIKKNATGNDWKWIGDLNDLSVKYFETDAENLEVHYEDPYVSLFSSNTIIDKLKNDLNKTTAPNQNKLDKKILDKINLFQNSLKDLKFSWDKRNKIYVVIKIGSFDIPLNLDIVNNTLDKTYNEKEEVSFDVRGFSNSIGSNKIQKLIVPVLGEDDDTYSSKAYGCLVIELDSSPRNLIYDDPIQINKNKIPSGSLSPYHLKRQIVPNFSDFFSKNEISLVFQKGPENLSESSTGPKFNFANISCDFRDGSEYQSLLRDFQNIYIDYDYGAPLVGPFRPNGLVRRIAGAYETKGPEDPRLSSGLSEDEGSEDRRSLASSAKNYSNWNDDNEEFSEEPIPITHTIENPNVSAVFFTLAISSLRDTAHTNFDGENRDAQDRLPAILEIEVEYGKISKGITIDPKIKKYAIIGMVEGQMLIDFGSPDSPVDDLESVRDVSSETFKESNINQLYELPPLTANEDPSITKRYIKITKKSTETNSVLLKKEASLYKVTEIIKSNLSYPFSSIIGMKIDARSFSSVPERTYDCRLKKIKIPSNYKPLNKDNSDKRYLKSEEEYRKQSPTLVYDGDWDGTFEDGWTDNPAWIIYDLLISKRYGLGAYLQEDQINKWELYKIGRFCDAVDSNGYFIGVPDMIGGLEPRYSCNIMFKEKTKIFDAINIVASLFRGSIFFSNSEIHFLDDRPRDPIAIFTNSNVKDGAFNYINNRRDQQFNTVEVAYLDRFDNYQTKIEYIQDETDIRNRGVFKTDINTLGVTSRAMARRIGQHLIYQTIKENQSVEFLAGLEALLCRPGDLIIIEDEMKSLSNNYGRVLDIDLSKKSIRIENAYETGSFDPKITLYTPTGLISSQEIQMLNDLDRSRVPYFDVTSGLIDSNDNVLTGRYYFSKYMQGYPSGNINQLSEQFPLYTGTNYPSLQKIFCHYSTGATGFVFSTGFYGIDSDTYNKVICNTGFEDIPSLNGGNSNLITGYRYDQSSSDKRGVQSAALTGKINVEFDTYNGILEEEISVVNNTQITIFNITGHSNANYGSELFIDQNDININLLSMIPQGSCYRVQRKEASDAVYKIISIRENSQNEYGVYCTKFDSGKFNSIENHITSDTLQNTFPATNPSNPSPYGPDKLKLDSPVITNFSIINAPFTISGRWNSVSNASSYSVRVSNIQSNKAEDFVVDEPINDFKITGTVYEDGDWKLSVTAMPSTERFIASDPSMSGLFITPSVPVYEKTFASNITFF